MYQKADFTLIGRRFRYNFYICELDKSINLICLKNGGVHILIYGRRG